MLQDRFAHHISALKKNGIPGKINIPEFSYKLEWDFFYNFLVQSISYARFSVKFHRLNFSGKNVQI